MGKRLLTKEYNKIVFETFKMPQRDYLDYYSNIIDENYKNNPNIIQNLELAVNRCIEWYKSKIDYSPDFEADKNGNKKRINPEETYIPLFPKFDTERNVNKAFFDDQIKIIHIIGSIINSKNKVLELENELPEPLREILEKIPFPDGFDYEDIKRRFEIIKKAPEIYITKLKKLHKELKAKKDELEETSKQPDLTGFKSSLEDKQIETLFDQLKSNYIDKNTNPDHFKAIFKDETLPEIEIKWIDKSKTRHEPNKQTIFEFFYLLKEHKYLKQDNFDTTATNPNNFYRKLETIFPDIKNFPQSNPYKYQNKTNRQKELEKIILSLKS